MMYDRPILTRERFLTKTLENLLSEGFIPFLGVPDVFPVDFKNRVYELFIYRYNRRRIGFQTLKDFSYAINEIYLGNSERYVELLKSKNIFTNPFITKIMQNEDTGESDFRDKHYMTNDGQYLKRDEARESSYSNNVNASENNDYNANIGSKDFNYKEATLSREQKREQHHLDDVTKFTDTPQQKIVSSNGSGGNGSTSTFSVVDDVVNGDLGGLMDNVFGTHNIGYSRDDMIALFNDGYLTTFNHKAIDEATDSVTMLGTGKVNYGRDLNASHAIGQNTGQGMSFTGNAGNSNSKENYNYLNNGETVSVNYKNSANTSLAYGMENQNISEAILKWRDTFEPFAYNFVKLFDDCFLIVF